MPGIWAFLLLFVGTVKSVSVIDAKNADTSLEENFSSKEISAKEFSYFEAKFNNQTNDSRGIKMPCQCKDSECGCCTGNILQNFNINMRQRLCMNVTYEPEEFSIGVKMSINDLVLFSNSVSGKSPPPFCVRVPRIKPLRFCGRFTNVYFINRNVHACIILEIEWNRKTIFSYNLDCMRLGANGVALVPAEAGGGLPHPTDQGTDDIEEYDELLDGQTTKKPNANATTKKPNRRKTTKKPISNEPTENPTPNATTKKPNRKKPTKRPISTEGTTKTPIANETTEVPVPNATTQKPIPQTIEVPSSNAAEEEPNSSAAEEKPSSNAVEEKPSPNAAGEESISNAISEKHIPKTTMEDPNLSRTTA